MKQRIVQIIKKIATSSFYLPFTWYFVLFSITIFLGWNWLKQKELAPYTAYSDVFELLLRVGFGFVVAIISLAFITAVVPFAYFFYVRRKKRIDYRIETDINNNQKIGKQNIQIYLKPVLKPLLGFVKLRLQYDNQTYSSKFSLVEESQKQLFSNCIEGKYHWPLPEIREYHIEKTVLYFEDFFQFFSFAITLKTNNRFFTQPLAKSIQEIKTFPRKTEETNIRIDELRKIEGEYLNYKNFEDNDDVRRIVWKIYAKNKELVVRTPEIMDPYASHIYLYSSYFINFDISGNSAAEIPFLNYFKTVNWAIYQQLLKQGYEVRYVADQPIPHHSIVDEQQAVKYSISTSKWHQQQDLKSYCKTKEAAMLLVHSFSNADHVAALAEQYGNEITIVFVKLSDSLKHQHILSWIQWLFVENEKNNIERYKTAWSLSLLKSKVIKNEKAIENILKKYSKPVLL